MSDRRTFLRGLVSLPLIGGGVTLIGNPVRAAVPVTDALLLRYVAFTKREHHAALTEWSLRQARSDDERARILRGHIPSGWFPDDRAVGMIVDAAPASARAAVILSAAGVPITT